jgi:hypothetical protein
VRKDNEFLSTLLEIVTEPEVQLVLGIIAMAVGGVLVWAGSETSMLAPVLATLGFALSFTGGARLINR